MESIYWVFVLLVCLCVTSTESLHIKRQITITEDETLDRQNMSFDVIAKHLGFVQHDLVENCPDDFLYDRQTNMCFQMHVDTPLTWSEAQRYCQHLGPRTHLATLDTAEKMDVVNDHLIEGGNMPHVTGDWDRRLWLGSIQSQQEGPWFWTTTGLALTEEITALWAEGQPDSSGNDEDCLSLLLGPGYPRWLLHDKECSRAVPFICERT